MIIKFPEFMESHPARLQAALAVGKLSGCHMFIELPDDFDFGPGQQPKKVFRGAGDVVAVFAKPIAKAIDAVAGTDLQHCAGCGQRQDEWNEAVPFKKK